MMFNVQVNLTLISASLLELSLCTHCTQETLLLTKSFSINQIFNIVLNMDNFLVNQYYDINTGQLETVEDLTGTRASVREDFQKKI